MTGPERSDPHAGETVELSLSELRGGPLATDEALREQLPGLETDRQVTDWGRSERVDALVDRTVYDFLYHYWFRVETEGIANVPRQGGALLLANHAGALPPDGPMIAKAIRQEHPSSRAVHVVADGRLRAMPGIGTLLTKLGSVSGHPADLHRLLFDERQLVLAFPEGSTGPRKPLKERYRLRRFGGGSPIAAALRARVPIVPVAIIGSEEAVPVLARLPRIPLAPALSRLSRLPLTTGLPLPAKVRIRFLEPVDTSGLDPELWRDGAFVQALGDDIRGLIQENVFELVAARRSVWLG